MSSHLKDELRQEQQFFEDAAIDRMMGTVMALASEVFVLRSRLRALEHQMGNSGLLDIDTIHKAASAAELAKTKIDAREFSEAILKPLLGLQDSVGPTE